MKLIENKQIFLLTYNKIFNSNTFNSKRRNKKFKGNSISMRLEENERTDFNKYLSNNNSTSKYTSNTKPKSFNKINHNLQKYKVPLTNKNKNESFINNYGTNRYSKPKRAFRKYSYFNEHASFVIKRVSNKNIK